MKPNNTIIVVIWKQRKKNKIETYTSLVGFIEHNEGFVLSTINNYISRKKIPFEDKRAIIHRVRVIGRK